MDTHRALEILNSPDTFLVTHNNHAVWIEEVNTDAGIAQVKDLATCKIRQIPLAQLIEEM